MGGEKFDSTHPEGYLFGENTDLNFLGTRPVAVGPKHLHELNQIPTTMLHPLIALPCLQLNTCCLNYIKEKKTPNPSFPSYKDLRWGSCGSCCSIYMFFRLIKISFCVSSCQKSTGLRDYYDLAGFTQAN